MRQQRPGGFPGTTRLGLCFRALTRSKQLLILKIANTACTSMVGHRNAMNGTASTLHLRAEQFAEPGSKASMIISLKLVTVRA